MDLLKVIKYKIDNLSEDSQLLPPGKIARYFIKFRHNPKKKESTNLIILTILTVEESYHNLSIFSKYGIYHIFPSSCSPTCKSKYLSSSFSQLLKSGFLKSLIKKTSQTKINSILKIFKDLSIYNKTIISVSLLKLLMMLIQLIILVFNISYIKGYFKITNINNVIYLDSMNFEALCILHFVPSIYTHRSRTKCTLVVMYPRVLHPRKTGSDRYQKLVDIYPCLTQLRKTSYDRYHTETYKFRLLIYSDKVELTGSKVLVIILNVILFKKLKLLLLLYLKIMNLISSLGCRLT